MPRLSIRRRSSTLEQLESRQLLSVAPHSCDVFDPAAVTINAAVAGVETRVVGYVSTGNSIEQPVQVEVQQASSPFARLGIVDLITNDCGLAAFDVEFPTETPLGQSITARILDSTVVPSAPLAVENSFIGGVKYSARSQQPLAGHFLELYRDADNNGQLGLSENEDKLFARRETDRLGRYFFTQLKDNTTYFLINPSDGEPLQGSSPDHYRITLENGVSTTEFVVDRFDDAPVSLVVDSNRTTSIVVSEADVLGGTRSLELRAIGDPSSIPSGVSVAEDSDSTLLEFSSAATPTMLDLTYGGTLTIPSELADGSVRFQFASFDAGLADFVTAQISATDNPGNAQQSTGLFSSTNTDTAFDVPLPQFATESQPFRTIGELKLTFNLDTVSDVDFRLDEISIVSNMMNGHDFIDRRRSEVNGTVYEDLNGNGEADAGEGLPGWVVTLDGDGIRKHAVSDDEGNYRFTNAVPNQFTVTQVDQPGWKNVVPGGSPASYHDLEVVAEMDLPSLDFVNRRSLGFKGSKRDDPFDEVRLGPDVVEDFNVVFLVDTSQSMVTLPFTEDDTSGNEFDLKWDAAKAVFSALLDDFQRSEIRDSAKLTLIQFSDEAKFRADAADADELVRLIDDLSGETFVAGTSYKEALSAAVQAIGNGPGHVVLLTDGVDPNEGNLDFYEQVENLGETGVSVLVMGGGDSLDRNRMRAIDRYFKELHSINDVQGFFTDSLIGRDFDQPGVQGITIYLDENNNGSLDEGEIRLTSGPNGEFEFDDLEPGTYRVREVVPNGFEQTFPDQACWIVTLTEAGDVSHATCEAPEDSLSWLVFGNRAEPQSISGVVWHDVNENGVRDDDEPGIPGATVWLGEFGFPIWHTKTQEDDPTTVNVDETGFYEFVGVFPGAYSVSVDKVPGFVPTAPNPPVYHHVVIGDRDIIGLNFGNELAGKIDGRKWYDEDGDGVFDAGEQPLSGWTIQLDRDGDGSVEMTASTDGNGYYEFDDLHRGDYAISEVQQIGWRQTYPAGASDPVVYPTGVVVTDIEAGDLDRDGLIDLVVVNDQPDSGVSILRNLGQSFSSPRFIPVGERAQHLVLADFNNNGNLDIAVAAVGRSANGSPSTDGVSILLNDGRGNYRKSQFIPVAGGSINLAAADLNSDGAIDLAVSSFVSNTISILTNNGDARFNSTQRIAVGKDPVSVSIVDLDGDGDDDLAVALAGESAFQTLWNDNGIYGGPLTTDTTVSKSRQFSTVSSGEHISYHNSDIATGDWNRDGLTDLAISEFEQNSVSFYLGDEGRSFAFSRTVQVGSRPRAVQHVDFDGDGDLDIVVISSESPSVTVIPNSIGTFGNPFSVTTSGHGQSFVVRDFDQNGTVDVAIAELLRGASIRYGRSNSHQVTLLQGDDKTRNFGNILSGLGDQFSAVRPNESPVQFVTTTTTLDVNRDGHLSPIDALLVINELNAGSKFEKRPAYDLNGDGFVSPIDALLLINALNQETAAAATRSYKDVDAACGLQHLLDERNSNGCANWARKPRPNLQT